jgi:tetratricopeptide (TPR) repeat protein
MAWFLTASLLLLGAAPVGAQESLNAARDLYAAAAYEDALDVLNRLRGRDRSESDSRTIEQYRAFCLLALGRVEEAERAIEAVVAAEPFYSPSTTEVSPRVRSAFTDVRRRMLPTIVQQKYAQAKATFDRKEFDSAPDQFKKVLDIFNDPDLGSAASRPPLSDLLTLSVGFHELAVSAATPPPPPTPPAPPPPVVVPPPSPVIGQIYGPSDGTVVPPITIRQTLPPHTRPRSEAAKGLLEVVIDERGEVESAVMRLPVDPSYDRTAVSATKSWRYTPATLSGVPVKFRKVIQISLEPQR